MALKYEDQYAEKLSGTSLVITPAETESIRIKKIGFAGLSSDVYATLTTDRTKVGYVYPYLGGLKMFPFPVAEETDYSPYDLKALEVIDLTYPVATGESFTITTSGNANIFVLYDIYDAGDVKNDEPNGSHADTLTFYQHVTNASAITTATSEVFSALDKNLNPTDFPAFPIKAVPAGQEFDLHAIGFMAIGRGNGAANIAYTKHLRLKYNREVLFDEAGLGWAVLGDSAHTANSYDYVPVYNTVPWNQKYLPVVKKFSTPLTFKQGDELLVEVGHQAGTAGSIEASKLNCWLLMTQRRV